MAWSWSTANCRSSRSDLPVDDGVSVRSAGEGHGVSVEERLRNGLLSRRLRYRQGVLVSDMPLDTNAALSDATGLSRSIASDDALLAELDGRVIEAAVAEEDGTLMLRMGAGLEIRVSRTIRSRHGS